VLGAGRRTHKNPLSFPAAAVTDEPSISDHFVGMFTGESAMERVARQRFVKFKKFIIEEVKVADAV